MGRIRAAWREAVVETREEALPKAPTGIAGLDEVTGGGLPRGRPTLVCGTAGCGKTLLSMEFLVRGATEFDEPGVFIAFEETPRELAENVRSLGFDLEDLVAQGRLAMDHVHVDRAEIEETGEWDLEALCIRLGYAIDKVGAKRVVIDTLEVLFSALNNQFVVRSELQRLFRWLKARGVTAIITAERGDGTLTRHGLEEYVSDCVLLLDHRVTEQVSTRRLRVVKYRGTRHGTNEYPFLIDEAGFTVLPITSIGLEHDAPTERVSTGVPQLDDMLGGVGVYRGSSILVSGPAGTGKTSLANHFAAAACARGERCLYLAFEESPEQIVRNMRSIGLDLRRHVDDGSLKVHSTRPTLHGLETHLALVHRLVRTFDPHVVVVDPISNLDAVGSAFEVQTMLMRLVDLLKSRGTTALFTSLYTGAGDYAITESGVSSLIDTWILLRNLEHNGERNRALHVLKSRGTAHSKQVREFILTDEGVQLVEVFVSDTGVLTGSARQLHLASEHARTAERARAWERKRAELARKRKAVEAQVAALLAEVEAEEHEAVADHSSEERLRLDGVAALDALAASRTGGRRIPGEEA
jgi:circadian clock protein KaiC